MSDEKAPDTAPVPETQANTPAQAAPEAKKEGYKIAILGTAQTSLKAAPFNDPTWKIWNMSANYQLQKRFDLWFEVHTPEVLLAASNNNVQYLEFLKKCGKALVAAHPSQWWPDAQQYPVERIFNQFGEYFTCTAAYQIAFAIMLHEDNLKEGGPGIDTIGLWGIDMAAAEGGEYDYQKPCVEHYLGIAKGKGIKIYIAPESPILRTNAPYGFTNVRLSREFTDRLIDLNRQIGDNDQKLIKLNTEQVQLKAIRDAFANIAKYWNL